MSWSSWPLVSGALALAVVWVRSVERRRLGGRREELLLARERGSDRPRLQFPRVDLARCAGCGTCVRACPEEGVLALVHGQALVVHGSRCIGHGRCAAECPTGAITLELADLAARRDIPILAQNLEVPGVPGLFLGGEVTGFALIRTAIGHGAAVAEEVARGAAGRREPGVLDLCIVGAGPAGLACALGARARELEFVVLEQDTLGGTVAKYPRAKLVMTQPVELPLHGRLAKSSFQKEELVELWTSLAKRHALPIETGVRFESLRRGEDGVFEVTTSTGSVRARHVVLALGRRGVPRKLGVPGEDTPKVSYGLLDAQGYRERALLVVGGGDSAVEAALALAEQPGNTVTLSYRQAAFTRLKARNEEAIERARASGAVNVLFRSQVRRIEADAVELALGEGEPLALPNDEVFVLAGGIPPFELLEKCGVSFDPAQRPPPAPAVRPRVGAASLAVMLLLAAAAAWLLSFHGYYGLPLHARPDSVLHDRLRPTGDVGLVLGVAAVVAIAANLAYLLRRNPRLGFAFGSLRRWMNVHVATGIAALLLALLHSGLRLQQSLGAHALLGLGVLVVTGAIGRWVYAFVPRATNGRELAVVEARAELVRVAEEWRVVDPALARRVRTEVEELVAHAALPGWLPQRLVALVRGELALARALERVRSESARAGLVAAQVAKVETLARRAYRSLLAANRYEELRGLLASWRYLHRWVALLVVLLVAAHVLSALRYAS